MDLNFRVFLIIRHTAKTEELEGNWEMKETEMDRCIYS